MSAMKGWPTLILKVIDIVTKAYRKFKQAERKKAIDKIKKDPGGAWNDKFSKSE